ncbi:unnamed protein product [marine sediment metagenome]|uniref:Uncharacterized protein n=1 Tax=marine sediment metagenome TaxID=412755 RepID=X1CQ13_9ZZZZ
MHQKQIGVSRIDTMICIEVTCTRCKIPMQCIAKIKIIGNGSIAHFLILESFSGIYKCPRCKKTVDIVVKER